MMDPVFRWIEHGWLSQWLRESSWAFLAIVVLHTLGMGVLAGGGSVIALRILGVARQIPVAPLRRFLPVLWAAFGVNLVSGLLLLTAYPTKALTNPVFFIKLTCIGLAVWVTVAIRDRVLSLPDGQPIPAAAKRLALASLILWVATITAGRLLAYTFTRLLVDLRAHF